MAALTVRSGRSGLYRRTIVANVEDQLTFADRAEAVEIFSDGADDLFVTVDGSAATIPAAGTDGTAFWLPAGVPSVRELVLSSSHHDSPVVRLVSPGTPTYSVSVPSS